LIDACCAQRLRDGTDGTLVPCGFTESSDACVDDISFWMPSHADHHTLNVDTATYLMKHVSAMFCSVIQQELLAVSWNKMDGVEFLSALCYPFL